MIFRILTLIIFSAATIRAQQVTILTLQPDTCGKDALITSLSPSNNYGNHGDILACGWTNNSVPVVTRALVEFDLSSIPANANIVGATLKLFHHTSFNNNTGHSTLSGSNAGWIERITQPWNEFTVTWNNQPSTTLTNRVVVPMSSNSTQNYTLDVTSLVQDMFADPQNSHGFLLKLDNENYYRSLLFASSDEPQLNLHPMLTVTFSGQLQSPADSCLHADTIITGTGGDTYGFNLPNIFTPNGDGVNDELTLLETDTIVKDFRITIYDRWGRIVHDGSLPWDGKDKGGQPCSDGVYYYYAIGRYFTSYAPRKGYFHLQR